MYSALLVFYKAHSGWIFIDQFVWLLKCEVYESLNSKPRNIDTVNREISAAVEICERQHGNLFENF